MLYCLVSYLRHVWDAVDNEKNDIYCKSCFFSFYFKGLSLGGGGGGMGMGCGGRLSNVGYVPPTRVDFSLSNLAPNSELFPEQALIFEVFAPE